MKRRCRFGSIAVAAIGAAFALTVTIGLGLTHTPLPPNPLTAELGLVSHGRWAVYHLGVSDCQCTGRLFDHLTARGPLPNTEESVLLLGEATPPATLSAAGFPVSNVSTELVQRAGIQGGPWIVVLNPEGKVAYSGGYDAEPVWDADIVERTRSGASLPVRDIVGCTLGRPAATGTRWRQLLTP